MFFFFFKQLYNEKEKKIVTKNRKHDFSNQKTKYEVFIFEYLGEKVGGWREDV